MSFDPQSGATDPPDSPRETPQPDSIVDALLGGMQAGVMIIDRTYHIQRSNPFLQDWLKRSDEELRGQQCFRMIHRRGTPCDDCPSAVAFATGSSARASHTGIDATGQITHAEISAMPVRDARGEVVWALEVARDVSDQVRHRNQLAALVDTLRVSKGQLRERNNELEGVNANLASVLESANDAILTADEAGRVISWNLAATTLYGRSAEQARGLELAAFVAEPDRALLENALGQVGLAGSAGATLALRGLRADGTSFPQELSLSAWRSDGGLRYTAIVRDNTERSALEEQLRLAQKMEAIGELAGGIAHDFNNLLTVVNSYASFGIDSLNEQDPLRADIEEILAAGERAASLTSQLLMFSRKQSFQPIQVDLNQSVVGMERMLGRLLGDDVEIVVVTTPAQAWIEMDPGRLDQILMNLAVNARDAMPQGGRLTIEVSTLDPGATSTPAGEAAKRGPIRLSVTDTGCGMTPEIAARVYEPFFTTKPLGRGTGLGLATVFGIVNQAGANIMLDSAVGKGTTFHVDFPHRPDALHEGALPAGGVVRGTGTVLVVEDQADVQRLARRILTSAGYNVITASDGEEGLRVYASHDGPIDLVLTDVVMPVMNGKEMVDHLKKLNPNTKVVFMSGYTDDVIADKGELPAGTGLILKPFSRASLTRGIRAALDTSTPPKVMRLP